MFLMNAVNRVKILTWFKVKLIVLVFYNVKIDENLWNIVTCSQGAFPNMRLCVFIARSVAVSFVPACPVAAASLQPSSVWPLVAMLSRTERVEPAAKSWDMHCRRNLAG